MEVSALKPAALSGLRGPTPLLRLQSDERLVALTRRGNQSAFETLVARYQARLLAFCRHMLNSREDAEDVLQEVFAAAFNAMVADERPINVRPWLYRIARNRSLNHLRRQTAIGVDSMDVHLADHGQTTADKVHKREEFRLLVGDVQELPETQRTALLLREIDALSYDQIAEAMDTTVPSVKSLLVRARVALAEASEARNLTCEEVREELGEVSESLRRVSPPVRRHLKECDRCSAFQAHLKANNRAMQALFPIGPLVVAKKLLAHVTAGAGASGGAAVSSAAAGSVAGGLITTGASALATKTAAGLAAAAIFTAGAVEVDHARSRFDDGSRALAIAAPARAVAPAAPPAVRVSPTTTESAPPPAHAPGPRTAAGASAAATTTAPSTTRTAATTQTATASTATSTGIAPPTPPAVPVPPTAPATPPPPPPVDSDEQTVTLPTGTAPAPAPTTPTAPPATTAPTTTPTTTGEAPPAPTPTPGATTPLEAPRMSPGATSSSSAKPHRPRKAKGSTATGKTGTSSSKAKAVAKPKRSRASRLARRAARRSDASSRG